MSKKWLQTFRIYVKEYNTYYRIHIGFIYILYGHVRETTNRDKPPILFQNLIIYLYNNT